jgi:hypothetical protein
MIGYYAEVRAYCMLRPYRFAVCGTVVIYKDLANAVTKQTISKLAGSNFISKTFRF